MIQRPGYFDPFRHPDRLRERRNMVLGLMRQNGFIGDRDYALAVEAPLTVAKTPRNRGSALLRRHGERQAAGMFQDADFQSNAFRIYTTLDMRLQRAAVEAIRLGMQNVDEQIAAAPFPGPDASRGAGGAGGHRSAHRRSEGAGRRPQLRHEPAQPRAGQAAARLHLQAVRLRRRARYRRGWLAARASPPAPPWSTSPPSSGSTKALQPGNFKNEFYGTVTLREALAHSLNNATVKVAEMVGYDAWWTWPTAPA
jgi:penicillin-binding protein 1B